MPAGDGATLDSPRSATLQPAPPPAAESLAAAETPRAGRAEVVSDVPAAPAAPARAPAREADAAVLAKAARDTEPAASSPATGVTGRLALAEAMRQRSETAGAPAAVQRSTEERAAATADPLALVLARAEQLRWQEDGEPARLSAAQHRWLSDVQAEVAGRWRAAAALPAGGAKVWLLDRARPGVALVVTESPEIWLASDGAVWRALLSPRARQAFEHARAPR
jgi:hypothetical protein